MHQNVLGTPFFETVLKVFGTTFWISLMMANIFPYIFKYSNYENIEKCTRMTNIEKENRELVLQMSD